MKVTLLSHTPDPEQLVAKAAKLCYSPIGVDDMEKHPDPDSTKKFVKMLLSMGHLSPVEHISFTFAVEGISRACSHQLVRHRLASYSQQSQRYVDLEDFNYITPPEIAEDPELNREYRMIMEDLGKKYKALGEKLKKKGREPKEALEDARFLLPNACETKVVFTMNARTLLHFLSIRGCERAQWEIRGMAREMQKLLVQVCPQIFSYAGPSCVYGRCSEGKMSCGRGEEIRTLYRQINGQ